jgi:hypothetical protein
MVVALVVLAAFTAASVVAWKVQQGRRRGRPEGALGGQVFAAGEEVAWVGATA